MTEPPSVAQSYLLRLWQANSAGKLVWRALLVTVQTGERRGFADVESLCAFLKAQTNGNASSDKRPLSTEP
jgi:hypothetical protein